MNRQSFSKDPALAFGVAAKELANREVEANSLSHTWQIFESALVSAMHLCWLLRLSVRKMTGALYIEYSLVY